MAKRRLSRQQKNRIQAAQDARSLDDRHTPGLVISHHGRQLLVELETGECVECRIKSNLGSIVCGDRVAVEQGRAEDYRVSALLPRDNLLRRVDGSGKLRAIAANVSRLFVCLAVVPEPNIFLLDQYLLSAEQQHIPACILLNKIDLASDSEPDPFGLTRIYEPMGYAIVKTSVKSGAGMAAFREMLSGEVAVLSGVSGVGKSSLTSWLLPDVEIKVAVLSQATDEGRHTTRASRLYHLPEPGGDLIDTPGVRGFSPFIDSDQPLADGFRDLQAQAPGCRFHNCLHRNEPGCAVIVANQAGKIEDSRYRNYLKLLDARDLI